MSEIKKPAFTRRCDINECIGLTIEAVSAGNPIAIRFTDGSVYQVSPEAGYYGDVGLSETENIGDYDMVRLGLWTDSEREAFQAQEKRKADERAEAHRRGEYERLKREFGDR